MSDKRPAVLYAGRVSREKGLALLESIDSFLYRRGVQYRLIVAGAAHAHAMTRTWQSALTPLFATYRSMLAAGAATATLRPVNPQAGLCAP